MHAYEAVRHGFVVGHGFAGPGRRRGALDAFVVLTFNWEDQQMY